MANGTGHPSARNCRGFVNRFGDETANATTPQSRYRGLISQLSWGELPYSYAISILHGKVEYLR